jgi:hypothetical protein
MPEIEFGTQMSSQVYSRNHPTSGRHVNVTELAQKNRELRKIKFVVRIGVFPILRLRADVLHLFNDDVYGASGETMSASEFHSMLSAADYILLHSIDPVPAVVEMLENSGSVYKKDASELVNYRADISDGYDQFISRMKAKYRQEIRRELRRFDDFFNKDVEVRLYSVDDGLDEFLKLASEIHSASWKQGKIREISKASIERWGQGRRWFGAVLFGGGTPIAYDNGHTDEAGVCTMPSCGYKSEFRSVSPGKVLMTHLLQRHEDLGIRVFDFDTGGALYKKVYCNEVRPIYDACIARKGSKFAYIFRVQRLSDRIYAYTRSLVKRIGAGSRIHRLVRS